MLGGGIGDAELGNPSNLVLGQHSEAMANVYSEETGRVPGHRGGGAAAWRNLGALAATFQLARFSGGREGASAQVTTRDAAVGEGPPQGGRAVGGRGGVKCCSTGRWGGPAFEAARATEGRRSPCPQPHDGWA